MTNETPQTAPIHQGAAFKMWAIHIEGTDDVHAMPDRAIADAACATLNTSIKQRGMEDMARAKVIEWPHGYETWAAEKENFWIDARPTGPAETQAILIRGVEYLVPLEVAAELLGLHLDLRLARSQPAEAAPARAVAAVLEELERATRKFPTWPTDPLHAVAVLGEEFGELTKAMLQLTYEPHKTSREEVHTEAIQTAAMALRLVMSLDTYQYARCEQHRQGAKTTASG